MKFCKDNCILTWKEEISVERENQNEDSFPANGDVMFWKYLRGLLKSVR